MSCSHRDKLKFHDKQSGIEKMICTKLMKEVKELREENKLLKKKLERK